MSISQIIGLLSGIALFLFGMTLMGDGLKRLSGNKLEPILFRLSGTPLKGLLLGTGVTAVIQSSSATSVMVVGFVNSGMMKLQQAIPVILGAILGTSITGWVICLSYIEGASGITSLLSTSTLTGIVAVIGILFRMFSKKPGRRHLGDVMMGFAVLMTGMSSMSGSVSSLGEQPWFTSLLTTVSRAPLGILAGIVFSALLQSASAAVGIIQALSLTGAMTFDSALPLLMGITIGASFPVLLSALGAGKEGKKTAYSYLVASGMGVMVCASLFYIASSIFPFPFMGTIVNPFSIALINTLLRLAMLCVLAPFTDVLEAVASFLCSSGKTEEKEEEIHLEERFLSHPALAIGQSRRVIGDMARQTKEAVEEASKLVDRYTEAGFNRVQQLEDNGDRHEDVLGSYLVRLARQEMTERQGREAYIFQHSLSDFERISDYASSIAKSCAELFEKQVTLSQEAREELKVALDAIREIMDLTVKCFVQEDEHTARQAQALHEVIDNLCDQLKSNHVDRLQRGVCTISQGFIFNDLVNSLERIGGHCSNIAVAISGLAADQPDDGFSAEGERAAERRSPEFESAFEHYTEIYSIRQAE